MRSARRLLLALTLALSMAGCQGFCDGPGLRRPLIIAAGPAGSAETACASALAGHLREAGWIDAAVETTSGGVENLRRLREGRAQLAFATADILGDAVNGQGIFQGATVSARTIAALFTSTLHLVVPADSPVDSLSDLRDRRVATDVQSGSTAPLAGRVLETAHVRPRAPRTALGLGDALTALQARSIDALFWLGGSPAPALQQLVSAGFSLRLVSTASVIPLLQQRYGRSLYTRADVPAGEYGSSEAVPTVGVATALVSASSMADEDAHRVAQGLFEVSGQPSSDGLKALCGVRRPAVDVPLPAAVHPGALRYFREGHSR